MYDYLSVPKCQKDLQQILLTQFRVFGSITRQSLNFRDLGLSVTYNLLGMCWPHIIFGLNFCSVFLVLFFVPSRFRDLKVIIAKFPLDVVRVVCLKKFVYGVNPTCF